MMTDRKTYAEQLFGSAAAGQTLTEGEELLAAFLRSSNVGVGILDSNVRYLAVNKVLAEMSGVPAQNHLGRTVREVLGEIGELIEHKFSQVLATRQGLKFEVSGKVPSRGESRHWIIDMFPIPSRQDSVTRIGAIVYELTTPRQLEQSLQQLDGQLRRETKRLRMLTDVMSLLSANWDIAQLFPRISARLRRVLRQEFASFALHDAATGLLVHHATDFPLGKELTSTVPVSTSETPAWRSMQERKPMIFSKEQLQGFDDEVARALLAEGLQSLCCAPLLRPEGPLGVVVLGSTRPDAFREEDLELINQVATQLAVAIENRRTAVEIEQLKQRLSEERSYLEGESRAEGQFPEIVGESVSLKQVLEQVAIVAVSEATVLILGETGTGKELVAHAIHRISRLKTGPFIKVNCAAIPTGLLESELFGHEKGAFTGAVSRKIGRIELADGGTLFLDEVGEIPAELQPKLLRVLQDQEFERLGSIRTVKVKVRVVAATNRNLNASIAKGEFRSDLFYRLNVFPVRNYVARHHVVSRPRRCRGEHRSHDVRWTIVDGARESAALESIPAAKPIRHPEEVDPLYLFACHLEWETNEEPGAGWELIAAAQSSHGETRSHARMLLSNSRHLPGIGLGVASAPRKRPQRMEEDEMKAPYGIEIIENCCECPEAGQTHFCQFSPHVLDLLSTTSHKSVLPAGAILFVEGQAPRGVFIICSGKVNLSTTSREGKLLILKTASAGEALGLSAAVSGVNYETTAETATPCHINFVDRKHFVELMQNHPEIGLQTAQCLSRDYQSAQRDIHDLVLTRSSAGKLARLLLSQVRDDEDLETGCKPTPMTHEEMAMRIGASRETVTRLISRLRRKRLIRLEGPMLVIKDRTALESLAV